MAKSRVPSNSAQRIKQLRATAGLTQTRLAELLGVTPAAVSQWESSTSSVLAENLVRLIGLSLSSDHSRAIPLDRYGFSIR